MSDIKKTAIKTAMILAAGRGQRMGALTLDTPKPLLNVHGKPLIEHQIERLKAVGIENIVINTAYKSEQIEAYCGLGEKWQVSIQYSREELALETAGGIKNALPLLGNAPFLVLNSDVFCDINLFELMSVELNANKALLMLVKNPAHNSKGDFRFKGVNTRQIEFGEQYTFSGFGIYHRQIFESLDSGFQALRNVFESLAENGNLEAVLHQGYWFDIGTPERLSWINEQSEEELSNTSGYNL